MQRILVTGGTGFIGRYVLEALASDPCEVVALSRSARADAANARFVTGDITDASLVRDLVRGADAVIHIAGCLKRPDQFVATNVEGTRHIVDACEQAAVPRLIYMSSVGVIGPTAASLVTEDSPRHPANAYERSKGAAEELVSAFGDRHPGTTTILRPTNVFGEHDPETHLLNLFAKLKSKRFFYVGTETADFYVNYLYVAEISALVRSLLTRTTPSSTYIVNTPMRLTEFIDAMKRALGDTTPIGHLPYWLVKAAALVGDRIPRAVMPIPPVSSLKLAEMTSPKQYSPARLMSELGWRPAYAIDTAVSNLCRHYHDKGWLV